MDMTISRLTVLYVEDEPEARDALKEYLKILVARLVTAENGRDGLNAMSDNKPDLIITDIKMPVMDGLDMISEIRKTDPRVPIIILTAYDDKNFIKRAADLNVYRFLTKPVFLKKLLKMMNECLFYINGTFVKADS